MSHVSIIGLQALVAALEDAGAARERFLVEAGLLATQLEDVHTRLPLADYARLARAALATTGDPALGLHMGERVAVGRFDVLGHLSEQSRSLREAIETSARYARIVTEGPRLELCEQGDLASVRFSLLAGDSPEVQVTAEFCTSSFLRLLRRFAGPNATPRRVLFAYAAPSHRAEYVRVFDGRAHFEQPYTGLEFERAWLDRAQPMGSPELRELLEARAEQLLARMDADAPASERVKRWLLGRDLQPRPTTDAIARELGLSGRSLRRRLHEERVSFSALVEDARAKQAKRMLATQQHSVEATAYAMGFGTPAAFSRAFKRWTGMTPSAYRRAH